MDATAKIAPCKAAIVGRLVAHLLTVGDEVVTFGQLCAAGGCSLTELKAGLLYRARKRLLRYHGAYFVLEDGGARRATPQEKIDGSVKDIEGVRRKAKLGLLKVESVSSDEYMALSAPMQMKHNVAVIVTRALQETARSDSQRALAARLEAEKATRLALGEAFRVVAEAKDKR